MIETSGLVQGATRLSKNCIYIYIKLINCTLMFNLLPVYKRFNIINLALFEQLKKQTKIMLKFWEHGTFISGL